MCVKYSTGHQLIWTHNRKSQNVSSTVDEQLHKPHHKIYGPRSASIFD